MRKIGIFDSAKANRLSKRLVAAAILYDFERAPNRFRKQIIKLDEIAFARRNGLALIAHKAKRNMDELYVIPHLGRNREELLEVKLLAVVCHIDDALRRIIGYAAADASKIGSRVVVASIRLAHNSYAKFFLLEIDNESPFRFLGESHRKELLHHAGHHRIVERFASISIELDSQLVVHTIELGNRNVDKALPQGKIIGISLLQFDKFGATSILPTLVFLGFCRRKNIAFLKIGYRK